MPANTISKNRGEYPIRQIYSFVVYYFNNSSQFSIVITALDDHDAANLNKFPPCRLDVDSGHSDKSTAAKVLALGALDVKNPMDVLTILRSP